MALLNRKIYIQFSNTMPIVMSGCGKVKHKKEQKIESCKMLYKG